MKTIAPRSASLALAFCLGLSSMVLCFGFADAAGREMAATTVEAAGADYPLVGEYAGTVATDSADAPRMAVHIVATGRETFEAAQYVGGLPGEPGHQASAVRLFGRRADDFLVLSGGPFAVLAQPDHCLVIDREGKYLGRLDRVRRESPTLGAAAPAEALVLFDGDGVEQFDRARVTDEGLLAEGADVKPMFQDFDLHVEFMLPFMPASRDQARGNSGIYLQSRYELQILDSFGLEAVNNGCGAVYQTREPDVNMCLPPLVWQTYDVSFTAPRWAAGGTKLRNARLTVWHNGVKIHDNVELPNKTGLGQAEGPSLLPTLLQDHGNPVRFRNIWIIDRGALPAANFPVSAEPADGQETPEAAPESAPESAPEAAPETAPDAEPDSAPEPLRAPALAER